MPLETNKKEENAQIEENQLQIPQKFKNLKVTTKQGKFGGGGNDDEQSTFDEIQETINQHNKEYGSSPLRARIRIQTNDENSILEKKKNKSNSSLEDSMKQLPPGLIQRPPQNQDIASLIKLDKSDSQSQQNLKLPVTHSLLAEIELPLSKAQQLEKKRMEKVLAASSLKKQQLGLPPQYPTSNASVTQSINQLLQKPESKTPLIIKKPSNKITETPYEIQSPQILKREFGLPQILQTQEDKLNLLNKSNYSMIKNQTLNKSQEVVDLQKYIQDATKKFKILRARQRQQMIGNHFRTHSQNRQSSQSTSKLGSPKAFNVSGEKALREMQMELKEMDDILEKIEQKPIEKMAKLEEQKLLVLRDASSDGMMRVEMKFGADQSSLDESVSPNQVRRNKFRNLLSKYGGSNLFGNAQPREQKPKQIMNRQKDVSSRFLREMDALHQRKLEEQYQDLQDENAILREKLKVVNAYMNTIVDKELQKQQLEEEKSKKIGELKLSENEKQEKYKALICKLQENSSKYLKLLQKDYEDLREECRRVSQPNYIENLEKHFKELNYQIHNENIEKNKLSIKQKLLYKIDISKKEIEQEKKILQFESELQRTLDKIKEIQDHRKKIDNEIKVLIPKVTQLQTRKSFIQQKLEQENIKTENYFKVHKLPIIQGQEKIFSLYGEQIEQLNKDIAKQKEDFESYKNKKTVKILKKQTIQLKTQKEVIEANRQIKDKEKEVQEQRELIAQLEKIISEQNLLNIPHNNYSLNGSQMQNSSIFKDSSIFVKGSGDHDLQGPPNFLTITDGLQQENQEYVIDDHLDDPNGDKELTNLLLKRQRTEMRGIDLIRSNQQKHQSFKHERTSSIALGLYPSPMTQLNNPFKQQKNEEGNSFYQQNFSTMIKNKNEKGNNGSAFKINQLIDDREADEPNVLFESPLGNIEKSLNESSKVSLSNKRKESQKSILTQKKESQKELSVIREKLKNKVATLPNQKKSKFAPLIKNGTTKTLTFQSNKIL